MKILLKTQHSKNKDHGIQSHLFMANRWRKIETVTDFIFLGSKITVDGDCSHEIKRCLLLVRKVMTNSDSILKSRDITLLKCLFFNMLSRLVITFLTRSKGLLISWLQSPSAVILEPKKINSVPLSIISPSICHEVMGPDAMILVFWMLSFKPAFHSPLSLSSRGSLVPLCFLP